MCDFELYDAVYQADCNLSRILASSSAASFDVDRLARAFFFCCVASSASDESQPEKGELEAAGEEGDKEGAVFTLSHGVIQGHSIAIEYRWWSQRI